MPLGERHGIPGLSGPWALDSSSGPGAAESPGAPSSVTASESGTRRPALCWLLRDGRASRASWPLGAVREVGLRTGGAVGPGLGRPPRSPLPSGAGPAASVKSPQARAAAGSTGRCSQRRWVGQAGPPCREEFGRETEQPGAGSQGRWGRDPSDGWARLTQPGQAAARGVVERRQAGWRLRSALRAERRLFGRAARAAVLPAVLPPLGRRVCRVCMRKNSQGFPARAARPGGPLRPAEALPQGPPEAVQ